MKKYIITIITILLLLSCSTNIQKIEFLGNSMSPNIKNNEIVEYIQNIDNINRSDIILYEIKNSKQIKRVIGIPGDEIKIENGKVYLKENGIFSEINESYIENNIKTLVNYKEDKVIYKVPENNYFIMGDNRERSTDSRDCFSSCSIKTKSNYIENVNIIGKVINK